MDRVQVFLREPIGAEKEVAGSVEDFRFEPYGVVHKQGERERIIPWRKVELVFRPVVKEPQGNLYY